MPRWRAADQPEAVANRLLQSSRALVAARSQPRAQKKAPGKAVSQGGRGQQPFPGAIGRWCALMRKSARAPSRHNASPYFRSDRRHPCQREALRGPQESLCERAFPVQTNPRGLSYSLESATENSTRPAIANSAAAGNVRRENREIATTGQGRFFAGFSPVSGLGWPTRLGLKARAVAPASAGGRMAAPRPRFAVSPRGQRIRNGESRGGYLGCRATLAAGRRGL